ncbi:hypothetical protein GHI93_01015 [Lactococcus hircilactis]|uniref:Uncharacterized protein n=1 Tax=Lactococcus hircilactis TaxID=1494462 RepID=A0A7X2D0Y0_9LACT|nr:MULTISPECIES: hypothetical protein [Lactococcus]MQW38530.1 hypothetical protein [Lactococcus hircilactis]TRW68972.1 hypothetical protein FNJ58_09690 [Lactococcus lactis]
MGKNKEEFSSEKRTLGDWGTPPKFIESVEWGSALFINFVFGYPNTMLARRKDFPLVWEKVCFSQMGCRGKAGFPLPDFRTEAERLG